MPKESNKEKASETISLPFRCARYTGLIGATLQAKLRSVSGSPAHLSALFIALIFYSSYQPFNEKERYKYCI